MGLLDGIQNLRGALDYHLARHNVLVANLSHVDTPGFRPLDIERTSFDQAFAHQVTVTQPLHQGGFGNSADAARWNVREDPDAQVGLDGNAVSVDKEAVKIATNQIRFDTLSTLTSHQLSELLWAANDGK